MNELSIFDFETHPVRIVTIDDVPHWVAPDLAACLGYGITPHMMRMLDDDQKGIHLVDTLGGPQSLSIVTEGGMWTCVIRSKRPEAKRFVRWLTDELLPTLRRTGTYALPGHAEHEPASNIIDVPRLNTALSVVREARRLFGDVTARAIWAELGLPLPGSHRLGYADSADHEIADAELASAIATWTRGKDRFSTAELMAGVGINPANPALKTRLHTIMRSAGWIYKKTYRRGATNIFTWHSPYVDITATSPAAGESVQ